MKQKHLKERRYIRFRELLIAARQNAGLSQEAVAGMIGRPQSYVSKYESGVRRLDVVEFLEVMEAIGTNPVEIIEALKQIRVTLGKA